MRESTSIALGLSFSSSKRPLTLAHWRTLGTLARCGSLPELLELEIHGSDTGDAGVVLLADGHRRGCLPSLVFLRLANAQIGPQGATALASALTKRALPSSITIDLGSNQIGDAGLAALAPSLRQLPKLDQLFLYNNQITDQGLASLLAPPTTGVLRADRSRGAPPPRQPDHRRGLRRARLRPPRRGPAGAQGAFLVGHPCERGGDGGHVWREGRAFRSVCLIWGS